MTNFFLFMLLVDLVGIIAVAGYMFCKADDHSTALKMGMVITIAGLAGQIGRNIYFLSTGDSPSDADLPLWALKDIGITWLALVFGYEKFIRGAKP
jgi:hypothetical protein